MNGITFCPKLAGSGACSTNIRFFLSPPNLCFLTREYSAEALDSHFPGIYRILVYLKYGFSCLWGLAEACLVWLSRYKTTYSAADAAIGNMQQPALEQQLCRRWMSAG